MSPQVRLTRWVTFSSGHRYWLAHLSAEENRSLFGEWASPYNHGHNYVLGVTVEGAVDAATGMVVNIKLIDDMLRSTVLRDFDGKSINDEVDAFRSKAPSVENLLAHLSTRLNGADSLGGIPDVHVRKLHLTEHALLWGELDLPENKMTLTRVYEFAASHRLHAPALSDAENLSLFGKCNNPAGHGHNYVLEVTVTGKPEPVTGMMVDISRLDCVVESEVVDRYDHKNLNEDIEEFRGAITTSEIVAQEIFRRLDGKLPAKLARVRLHETARNVFEVSAT